MTSSPPPSPTRCTLSPPPSPFRDELPVTATDERGMVIENGGQKTDASSEIRPVTEKRSRRTRRTVTYISRHFSQDGEDQQEPQKPPRGRVKAKSRKKAENEAAEGSLKVEALATPLSTPSKSKPTQRNYYGLNVDELSSDSDLTDVPDDLGPDPFEAISELVAVKAKKQNKKSKHPTISPYFPSPHKPRPHFLSTLPFPPLSAERFGLMQERLAHDPFRLLIATIFLNKTPGERAMPVFYKLMEQYPDPEALAKAEASDITKIIQKLGFQNQRARKIVAMSKAWVGKPPVKGKRYRKVDYPVKGDGKNVKVDDVLDNSDKRVAWEISHLPGIGAYGHDSWRMFCRDALLGKARDWNGEDAEDQNFEPEWKRVLPLDKELRAWMTWMWLKEGWIWNKETGNRTKASEELMDMARGGGIVVEEQEKATLTLQQMDRGDVLHQEKRGKVGIPAGQVLTASDPRTLDTTENTGI